MRTFEDSPAVRSHVPLLVSLVGPSGSGKTKSALRLATGMREVSGGEIFMIDSEAARGLHYADDYNFRHVPMLAPFHPLDYLAALKHCVSRGATNIIIDSQSHVWEGPGGVLETHETECERLMKAWSSTRDKVQMSAWQKPKADLRRYINEFLQLRVNLLFCFRAKEKLKIIPGKAPIDQGWQAIAPEEMIFEMTVSFLLYPGSGGVPTWKPNEDQEKRMMKLPQQFMDVLKQPRPLDEQIGRSMAEWAAGGKPAPNLLDVGRGAARQGSESLKLWWGTVPGAQKKILKASLDGELKALAAESDRLKESPEDLDENGQPIPPPSSMKTWSESENPAR